MSIYIVGDHGFEELIGIGEVIGIQENGLIQVGIRAAVEGHETIIQKIAENERLKDIRIKTSLPRYTSQLLRSGGTNG